MDLNAGNGDFQNPGSFKDCAKLKKIEIPKGWTKVPEYLFADCSGLENVVIPNTVTELGIKAFSHCNISDVVIPDSVRTIDAECFAGCPLKRVTGGKYLESITESDYKNYNPMPGDDGAPEATFGDGTSVFYGYKGSYLEKWAPEKGYRFVVLEAEGSAKIFGRNLSLDGRIGADIYVQVSDDILKDEYAYATITIGDRKDKVTRQYETTTKRKGETTLIL